ncbi:MAG: multiheme c-type cytochrome [Pirellulales bacterium]
MARQLAYAILAALALTAIGAAAYDWYTPLPSDSVRSATYVGGQTCAKCHQGEFQLWHGSHHDRAMEVATEESVLGDFNDAEFERLGVTTKFFRRDGKFMVNTEGPDGENHDYEIKYTFGIDPLQQYMVEFPDGRVQVLRVSWDTNRKRWFEVTPPDVPNERLLPGDPLHWTGVAQNWNTTCAECHSTNLEKNYDLVTDTYKTTFSEIDVSCEECHGPGSVHVELANRWSPLWDRNVGYGLSNLKTVANTAQIETCAKCHSRRHALHADFRPGRPLLDYYEPTVLSPGLYHPDGQILDEVYEYSSFLESKMHANRVRCSDCHDPHSLKLKFSGNKLCTQCHIAGKYDTPTHHHHPAESAGASCIACHMGTQMYMVVDERHDHSFRVPRPDLTVEFGVPNTCNKCHNLPHETPEWAAETVRKWYGDKRPDDPHWGPAFAAASRGAPEGEKLLQALMFRPATPSIVKATALSLSNQYQTPDIAELQERALDDDDPLVRATAVGVLLPTEPISHFFSLLGERLTDRSRAVRIAAARRLASVPRANIDPSYHAALDRALDEYRSAQQLNLERAAPHINLGMLARDEGNFDEAEKELRTAIRLEPQLTGPRSELASLLMRENPNNEEISELRAGEADNLDRDSKLLPDNAVVFYRLGLLRYLLGEYTAAARAMNRACELVPSNFDYRMTLALLHEKWYERDGDQAQYDAAVAALDAMSQLRPKDPRTEQIRARLTTTRQAKEAAIRPPSAP